MARKSFNEKLKQNKDLPKVVQVTDPKSVMRYGGDKMLVAPPLAYDEQMRRVPEGKVITADYLRSYLAQKHEADFTCPLTAGIFINIAAHASAERGEDPTPYWRTLKKDGRLNEKYPEGIQGHKTFLEREGHTVIQKGNTYYVKDYQDKEFDLNS
ncbi:hypothetical protein DesLBE_1044 [Desulfitobacterium sp. LBE]|uniref:Methylated DNA-protein cysteine methyltransferase n=4 Tax=root TaxID=1 RepID=A0A098AWY9_DESHA|nr:MULTISPECIES: hypothetical protein [Desulfitobacterium]ACL20351.1 conserved hypothetical protein [Desulfitobacterium hafniense DCB-2]EHL05594.1 hypothetical protein HMPREF0322_03702 [Desulfitobacterium hafniense DP7]KTE90553.1 methylated DNA-protein cysteine methyltransferase [Desulfitobacterium hafniense]MEA5021637.1 methylated DNA-protein cysteine methyltransferase [Desulfitobacterium hafniense]TWH56792.1 hypothetical protein DesLBE_1044 [Desulfitobacterium sp. LBE]